ncbi:hypothetical protein [Phenylobacterium zucineum]|uniref:hypothetical protein n=1 Tax=Phenylobacterium zucineum TaxID=284016 RepID=UPI00165024F1|nr:hypothetical protein [Phenylobacterium zucineum]
MRRVPQLLILAALLTSACASHGDAPGCHGARRPANPHGSVLAPDAQQPPLPAGKGGCA